MLVRVRSPLIIYYCLHTVYMSVSDKPAPGFGTDLKTFCGEANVDNGTFRKQQAGNGQ